jgi:DNA-binding CsgD family transcriptional regulator
VENEVVLVGPESLARVWQQVNRIRNQESTALLMALVHDIIRPFGLQSFVFVSMRRGDFRRESYRYLIGCDAAWCQLYRARNWHMNDPFMEHAVNESTMVLGSAIKTGTASQREMLAQAANHGFRSGMVVPAHGAAGARIGVLYLGSAAPPEVIEGPLWAHRLVMRQLAFELYEWWAVKLQAYAISRAHLDDTDVTLLRYKQDGFTTAQICSVLGFKTRMVDSRLTRIYAKLGVSNMKDAIAKATRAGVL